MATSPALVQMRDREVSTEDEEAALRGTDTRRVAPVLEESTGYSRYDLIVLGMLGLLTAGVIVQMAVRDMNGPIVEACYNADGTRIPLSKHIHCVGRNATKTFSDFLDGQGAKKEHPFYAAERDRLHRTPTGRGPLDSDAPPIEGGAVHRAVALAPLEDEEDDAAADSAAARAQRAADGAAGTPAEASVTDPATATADDAFSPNDSGIPT